MATVDAVLAHQLDLLFGQHLSRLVCCAIFAVSRVHNVVIPIKVCQVQNAHQSTSVKFQPSCWHG